MTLDGMIGRKFNLLTVIDAVSERNSVGRVMWLCKCDCGEECVREGVKLRNGTSKSCGCLNHVVVDILGKRFGKLVVMALNPLRNKHGGAMWDCICDCGKNKTYSYQLLKNGKAVSCGCKSKEWQRIFGEQASVHGLCKHPLYKQFHGIIDRCYNPHTPNYPMYGGKGVSVCDEWRNDFKTFYDWALANGWERGMHIDKDHKAITAGVKPMLYSPEWCSVMTHFENSQRKRNSILIEYSGETHNLTEWANKLGIKKHTLLFRIERKWPLEKAFNPAKQYYTVK